MVHFAYFRRSLKGSGQVRTVTPGHRTISLSLSLSASCSLSLNYLPADLVYFPYSNDRIMSDMLKKVALAPHRRTRKYTHPLVHTRTPVHTHS